MYQLLIVIQIAKLNLNRPAYCISSKFLIVIPVKLLIPANCNPTKHQVGFFDIEQFNCVNNTPGSRVDIILRVINLVVVCGNQDDQSYEVRRDLYFCLPTYRKNTTALGDRAIAEQYDGNQKQTDNFFHMWVPFTPHPAFYLGV